ncbi:hypothetical protein DDE82_000606 [Stemphylium lycopersici]|nr:hypothetical protein TW65_00869 [Stemphylium lycopersici]RAR11659.1 hypothetical protein DDE82_000606 [Stemphylium lycopersici]
MSTRSLGVHSVTRNAKTLPKAISYAPYFCVAASTSWHMLQLKRAFGELPTEIPPQKHSQLSS